MSPLHNIRPSLFRDHHQCIADSYDSFLPSRHHSYSILFCYLKKMAPQAGWLHFYCLNLALQLLGMLHVSGMAGDHICYHYTMNMISFHFHSSNTYMKHIFRGRTTFMQVVFMARSLLLSIHWDALVMVSLLSLTQWAEGYHCRTLNWSYALQFFQ